MAPSPPRTGKVVYRLLPQGRRTWHRRRRMLDRKAAKVIPALARGGSAAGRDETSRIGASARREALALATSADP